jgi:dienelactone hydrolase
MFALAAASVSAADGISTDASSEGPAQTAYAPEKGPGPAIIVISGATGPASYQSYAAELARLGYYSVLLTGSDILNTGRDGPVNLRNAIDRAQRSPHAVPSKVAVIGFSLGGGGALAHAAGMPDLVSVVAVYYPFTSFKAGPVSLVQNFRVPVLFLAAELDRYKNCCLIESARAIEAAALASGAKFELVVYPQANHGFNLETGARGEPLRAYRREDAADAWRRTTEMLRLYHPLR